MMPLAMATAGEILIIKNLRCNEETKKHLLEIGFSTGEKAEVIKNTSSGIIVNIKGVKIALNRGLATGIIVEKE